MIGKLEGNKDSIQVSAGQRLNYNFMRVKTQLNSQKWEPHGKRDLFSFNGLNITYSSWRGREWIAVRSRGGGINSGW